MTGRETHTKTVQAHQLGECKIVRSDWPYDCDAKTKHPDHAVYVCETHGAWWHEA